MGTALVGGEDQWALEEIEKLLTRATLSSPIPYY